MYDSHYYDYQHKATSPISFLAECQLGEIWYSNIAAVSAYNNTIIPIIMELSLSSTGS